MPNPPRDVGGRIPRPGAPVTRGVGRRPPTRIVPWRDRPEYDPGPDLTWPTPLLPDDRNSPLNDRQRLTTAPGVGNQTRIIYGKRPTGADIVYWKVQGPYLYVAYLVCVGPINAFTQLRWSGKTAQEWGLTLGTHYNTYLGTSSQALDPIISAIEPRWVSRKPFKAYITARLDLANEAFHGLNPLEFEAVVEGRKCRDPRQGDFTTRYYTTNPVLCTLDLVVDKNFGMQMAEADIDYTLAPDNSGSWNASATKCDGIIATQPAAPLSAPTFAAVQDDNDWTPLGQGNVYDWTYTNVAGGVESAKSAASAAYAMDWTTGAKRITLTRAAGPPGTTAARFYRRIQGLPYKFVGEVPDNVTLTMVDRVSDSQAGHEPPLVQDVKKFELCLVIQSQASAASWLNTLRGMYQGYFIWNNGKFQCFIDDVRARAQVGGVDAEFNDQNAWDFEFDEKGMDETPSKVVVHFIDREKADEDNAAQSEHPYISQPPTDADREDKRQFDYRYLGVPTYDIAKRLSIYLFNRGQLAKTIRWKANSYGEQIATGDRVRLNTTYFGFDVDVIVTNKQLRLFGWNFVGEVYLAGTYSNTLQINPSINSFPLPSPYDPIPVVINPTADEVIETMSDGTVISRIKISWTNPAYYYFGSVSITVDDGLNVTNLGEFMGNITTTYFDRPRLGVTHAITLRVRSSIIPALVSAAITVFCTPNFAGSNDYVPMVHNVVDAGNGKVYWDEPPNIGIVTQYASSFWTNNGFPDYVAAALNDGDLNSQAFSLNVASADFVYDAGVGNTKAFTSIRVTATSAVLTAAHTFGVQWSDDGVGYNNFTHFPGLVPGGKHWVDQWAVAVGTHRWWKFFWSLPAETTGVAELQFMESTGANPYPLVKEYEVFEDSTPPRLLAVIPAVSRPTITAPLDVSLALRPGATAINIHIVVVGQGGGRSGRRFQQVEEILLAYSPSFRVQSAAGLPVQQPGTGGVEDLFLMGRIGAVYRDLTLVNGDNDNVPLGGRSTQRINGVTAAFAVTGVDDGSDGVLTFLVNPTVHTMTIKHEDAGSLANNRIICPEDVDLDVPGPGAVTLLWDPTSSRNRVINSTAAGGGGGGGGDITEVIAGLGLGGGGASGSVTLDLKIDELTLEATPDYSADHLAIYDASATTHKKVLFGKVAFGTNLKSSYASRPSAGIDGRIHLSSDGPSIARDNGTIWEHWGTSKQYIEPDDSGFTWTNQGTASTVTEYGTVLFIDQQAGSLRIRKKAAPSTPYSIIACIRPYFHPAMISAGSAFGLGFRESSTGKLAFWLIQNVSGSCRLASTKYTNESTFSAFYAASDFVLSATPFGYGRGEIWLTIRDDGTNRILSYSPDGTPSSWMMMHSVGRTDFCTGNEVFWCNFSGNVGFPQRTRMMSWEQTA